MDPDLALMLMREAARDVRDALARDDVTAYAEALADATEALDQWLTRGGFLPNAWSR